MCELGVKVPPASYKRNSAVNLRSRGCGLVTLAYEISGVSGFVGRDKQVGVVPQGHIAYIVMNNGSVPFLPDGTRFQQVRLLAKGSYGLVVLAVDKETGQHVALKCISRGGQITKWVEREVLNHHRLRHPHIIRLKQVFLTTAYLVLVLEFAAGGDLARAVARCGCLPEEDARWLFQQIMCAVDYCHRMGVANRDIKLDNVLLSDPGPRPLVKLADFGFSKDENNQSAPGSRVGTPAYLAPEVISNVDGQSYDGKKADVWSCGVLLYAMLVGSYPFVRPEDSKLAPARQLHNVVQRILAVQYTFPTSRPLSPSCQDLIARMLVPSPAQRLSVEQVLHHPWCSQGLQPGTLTFNEMMVARSLAEQPTPQVLRDIQAIVQQARQEPKPAGEPATPAQQEKPQEGGLQDPSAVVSSSWHDSSFLGSSGIVDDALDAADDSAEYTYHSV